MGQIETHQSQLTFSNVMQRLYSGMSRGTALNQQMFLHMVFEDFDQKYDAGSSFERLNSTHINKMMRGGDIPSRLVAEHYYERKDDGSFEKHLEEKILPLLQDTDNTIGILLNMVRYDPFLSEHKREELLATGTNNSQFLAAVLRYVVTSPLVRQQKGEGIDLRFLFRGYRPPKPCKTFLGREQEIYELHVAVQTHGKVWVTSFPGMGKSETVKAFAQEYADDYQEMIWINCTESAKHSVASLMLTGVNTGGSEDDRYLVRERLLRMLTDQSILFLDNVNWDVAEDEELQVILEEYPCKVVVISRNADAMSEQVIINEIQDENDRIELVKTFYSKTDEYRDTIKEIMACVGYHTMAMEMAARLLALGAAEPKELLEHLKCKNLLNDTPDTFAMRKDQRQKRDNYKGFIRQLFALHDLDGYEKQILCCLALMPAEGVEIVLFRQFIQAADGNAIHELIDKGLILFDSGRLSLQPLMLETILTELQPTIGSCSDMIIHITYLLRIQWHKLFDHSMVETIVANVIRYVANGNEAVYLDFLHAAYDYGDKYSLEGLKNTVFYELYREIVENGNGSEQDKILCCVESANRVTDEETQLKFLAVAYKLMKGGTPVSLEIRFSILSQYGMLLGQTPQKALARECLDEAMELVMHAKIVVTESVVQTAVMRATMIADTDNNYDGIGELEKLYQYVAAIDSEAAVLPAIQLAAASICERKKNYSSALTFAEQALKHNLAIHGVTAMVTRENSKIVNNLRQKCDDELADSHGDQ